MSFQSPGKFVEDQRFENLEEAVFRLGKQDLNNQRSALYKSRRWNNEPRKSSHNRREESRNSRMQEELDEIESVNSNQSHSSNHSDIFQMMKERSVNNPTVNSSPQSPDQAEITQNKQMAPLVQPEQVSSFSL